MPAKFLKFLGAVAAVVVIAVVGFVADANMRIATEERAAPADGAPGKFLTIGGHQFHVHTLPNKVGGDVMVDPTGAPILFIHGFGAPGQAWLPWAARMAATRALIIPDMLGFGHSERVLEPGAHYTAKGRAAALAEMLDILGVRQVDIVGLSMGGAVAAQFALDYPERARRIVFMDAAIYPQTNIGPRMGMLPLALGEALTWHVLGSGAFGAPSQFCGGEDNCAWLRSVRVKGSIAALRAMGATALMNAAEDAALAAKVSEIKAPSLVLWGGEDMLVPVANGDRLARELKTNFVIVAGAGHVPYMEQPDKTAERVMNFFAAAPP